jgi:hypothetical protein
VFGGARAKKEEDVQKEAEAKKEEEAKKVPEDAFKAFQGSGNKLK